MEEIQKEEVVDYVQEKLNSSILSKDHTRFAARYHHNTDYLLAPSIIKHGFLSAIDQQKNGISNYSREVLETTMIDDSHVNGNNGVSFAVMGLKDLYPYEFEYDPKGYTSSVDFIVDIPWLLVRNTENYGNEFISNIPVDPKYIRYLDLRIRKLLMIYLANGDYNSLIEKYNGIITISRAIKKHHPNIILRENSDEQDTSLDYEKIADYPKVKIKK